MGQDLSRSGSEVLDFQDSETSDSDDSEDEYSSSGEDSKENSPGSKPVHHEKRYRRSAEFIKVNQRPMMEMKPGSNVWYQARIVKERPLEVLVTFPGQSSCL